MKTEDKDKTAHHIEVVVLEDGKEVASAVLRNDGAPAFRGSPVLPECTRELTRCLLAGTAEVRKPE